MSDVSRNILAEKQLKKMSIVCKEDACKAVMLYGKLQQHLDSECQAVTIKCRYAGLGARTSTHRH